MNFFPDSKRTVSAKNDRRRTNFSLGSDKVVYETVAQAANIERQQSAKYRNTNLEIEKVQNEERNGGVSDKCIIF